MNQEERNALRRAVEQARWLLEEEVSDQLEGVYGVLPNGTVLDDAPGDHLMREHLLELISHHRAGGETAKGAFERTKRELAFTTLNRFAALKMAERRGLVRECVSKGLQSSGIRELAECAPELRAGLQDGGYRLLLEAMMDELSLGLNVLFDRRAPAGLIWPRPKVLDELLNVLNAPELAGLWEQDETIGWVYQYFNLPEERKAMRDASQAPRSSRELAVRNQFFTPRYVVAFLTDNALGRIWYEMRKGDTALRESCHYLVRRPSEIFLDPGESAPTADASEPDLTQEELLKQPLYIEHRPKKDPRDIRVLDPACGSGHFLLYAFDLLERIYEEAWEDSESPASETTGRALREDFGSLDALRRVIPKLIIEHNLHGIDIDPRAVQIAALALWLRAQKAWQSMGLKPTERPQITRSNVVTAEPMPGEENMRREIIDGLRPKVLGQLVDVVFERMQLAGEVGSLLKIEEEIKDGIASARKQWLESSAGEKQLLIPGVSPARPEQQKLRFDLTGVDDERFWEEAESHILEALEAYAERVDNGGSFHRRLFADDAARGFAFIDVCRKRYDVVLMNPPFGLGLRKTFDWAKTTYRDGYVDIYASFLLRGLCLSRGTVGAITSRSWLITKKLQRLRRDVLLPRIHTLIDLGWPVMDDATVHSCALVFDTKQSKFRSFLVFDRRSRYKKDDELEEAVRLASLDDTYLTDRVEILALPQEKLLYQLPSSLLYLLRTGSHFSTTISIARQGMKTFDDFRFVRLRIECNPRHVGTNMIWEPLTKGGDFSMFYSDLPLVVRWERGGSQICEVNRKVNGQTAQARQASEHYRKVGGTYSRRCKDFGVRALPAGFIIGEKGPAILPVKQVSPLLAVGILNSRIVNILVNLQANAKQYDTGIIDRLPVGKFSACSVRKIEVQCERAIEAVRELSIWKEEEILFASLPLDSTLMNTMRHIERAQERTRELITECLSEINAVVDDAYGIDSSDLTQCLEGSAVIADEEIRATEKEARATDYDAEKSDGGSDLDAENEFALERVTRTDLAGRVFCYLLGVVFGRWDVRIALRASLVPKLPDPFDPLPACPPGMLVDTNGLPAKSGGIVSEEWLRVRPDVKTVPPKGAVAQPIINDSHYPLHISWAGILVDDPGLDGNQPHRDDIVRRVREVLDVIWKDKAHEIEQETCVILGVRDLRDYLRRPSGLFADHLSRYSRSRRKAPIYWPLSTASGAYTAWVYYHRLTEDTLYRIVSDYVSPKISQLEDRITQREAEQKAAEGRAASRLAKELGELAELLQELKELRDELLRVAHLPYRPNLNDGVQITAAPLWRLFRLPKWRAELEKTWRALERGDSDWAHLAYAIWPDRVREKCHSDRSLAIAHDLEGLYQEKEATEGRGRRKRRRAG